MQDLFFTNKDILLDRLKHLQIFSSATVHELGTHLHYTSAPRRVREWAEDKKYLRKLDEEEIRFRGLWKKGNAHLAWYKIIDVSPEEI